MRPGKVLQELCLNFSGCPHLFHFIYKLGGCIREENVCPEKADGKGGEEGVIARTFPSRHGTWNGSRWVMASRLARDSSRVPAGGPLERMK